MDSCCLNLSFKSENANILCLNWSEEDDAELMAIINCDALPIYSKTNKIKLSSSPLDNTAIKNSLSTSSNKSKMDTVKESKHYRSTDKVSQLRNICEDADILRLDWSKEDDAELMAIVNGDEFLLPSKTNKIELSSSPPENKVNNPDTTKDGLSTNSVKSKTESVRESKPRRSPSPYRYKRKVCELFMQGRCKLDSRCCNFHPDRRRRDESEFRYYKRKRSIDNQDAEEHRSRNSSEYGTRKRVRNNSRSPPRSRDGCHASKKRKVHYFS